MNIDIEEKKRVLAQLLEDDVLVHTTERETVEKSVVEIDWHKYIILRGPNNHQTRSVINKDMKQWYGAVLKSYKIISNKIRDKYYPDPVPYNLQIPPVLYFSHTDDEDIVVQKFIEGETYTQVRENPQTPEEDWKTLALFHNDRQKITDELAEETNGKGPSHKTFDIKLWNKNIRMFEDFAIKNDRSGELLPPHGDNVICTKEQDKWTFWLTDAVLSWYLV